MPYWKKKKEKRKKSLAKHNIRFKMAEKRSSEFENESLLLLKILQKTKKKNEESDICRTSSNTLAYIYESSKVRREREKDR